MTLVYSGYKGVRGEVIKDAIFPGPNKLQMSLALLLKV